MTTQTDIVPKLAKAVSYDTEVLRAVGLPQERLNSLFDRANKGKKIMNWIGGPLLALVMVAHYGGKLDKEENMSRNLAVFFGSVAAFCVAVGVGGAKVKNVKREIDEARDMQLVALAKNSSGNQPS